MKKITIIVALIVMTIATQAQNGVDLSDYYFKNIKITLPHSQKGIAYSLCYVDQKDKLLVPIGTPVAGTGKELDFYPSLTGTKVYSSIDGKNWKLASTQNSFLLR